MIDYEAGLLIRILKRSFIKNLPESSKIIFAFLATLHFNMIKQAYTVCIAMLTLILL